MNRRTARDDEGSVMLLVLGFTVVVGLLLVLVVDVSTVLLAQRGVASAADSAALRAAQQLDEKVFYGSGLGAAVPLDGDVVEGLVQEYGAQNVPPVQMGATVVGGGFTVEVQASRTVSLPFGGLFDAPTVTVRAVARATSPLAPLPAPAAG